MNLPAASAKLDPQIKSDIGLLGFNRKGEKVEEDT
jgi:hypothetical protein